MRDFLTPAKAFLSIAILALGASVASAQDKPSSDMAEQCPGLVAQAPRIVPAAFRPAALQGGDARITFVGHSTFLIESTRLVRIATDYNDYVRPPITPDIVTMNRAHSTHYSETPDSGIKHVLRGWTADGKPAAHDVTFQDVRVRSVATNIRDFGGGTMRHGNSIFIFEIGGLCIAHLGHLHHTLMQAQLNEMGRVDAVMVPVDGSYTLDLEGMIEVLKALKAKIMIPMHYFSEFTLNRFVARIAQDWPVEFNATPSIVLSRASLPETPKVIVLPGR